MNPSPLLAGLLAVLVIFPLTARACLWVDGSTLEGEPVSHNDSLSLARRVAQALKQTPADKLRELEGSGRGASDEREREAVRKILSGQAREAISLLQKIEEDASGQYSTAANLGTAYELAGDNRNALKWINEGLRRNPESHHGTEWLHTLILETKLRLETDPDDLKAHRILPLPEKFARGTRISIGGAERTMQQVMDALSYQLSERMVFVKPPDPVVADLLFTAALCEAQTGILENAVALLKQSAAYGFQDPERLLATEAQYLALKDAAGRKRLEAAERRRQIRNWCLAFAGVVGGGGIFAICYRRKYLAEKKIREQHPVP